MKISEKCLTLHLYRKDETLSALRWAILNHNLEESVYWALELYDSDMQNDAIQMIQYTWVTQIGIGSWAQFRTIVELEELDRDEWISLILSWALIKEHNSTAFHLLIRGATKPINWIPRFPHTREYHDIVNLIKDTLRRRKLVDAWLIARAVDTNTQWTIIDELANEKGRSDHIGILRKSYLSQYEQLATAFILVSLDDTTWNTITTLPSMKRVPDEIQKAIDTWDMEESIRTRRVFTIRAEALTYLCQRGELPNTQTYESELTDTFLESLQESPYWSSILEQYMDDTVWKSDTHKELFYDTYFSLDAGDIPDEWPREEREKSHGHGIGRAANLARKRFIHTIGQRSKALGLWNSTISECDCDMDWDTVYPKLMPECNQAITQHLPFKPIRLVFEIAN